VKIVAISPQPSNDEAAAIAAALGRAYAMRANGSLQVRSRWRSELKLAATPELKLGCYNAELGYDVSKQRSWSQTARLEDLDAGV
jgi:hypothetical protein